MASLPVWKGGGPLWVDNGSGVLVPAWAADDATACACCETDQPFDDCDCSCGEFQAQITSVTFAVSGCADYVCPTTPISGGEDCRDVGGPTQNLSFSGYNGVYVVPLSGPLVLGIAGDSGHRGKYLLTEWAHRLDSGIQRCFQLNFYIYQVNLTSLNCTGATCSFDLQTFWDDDGTFAGGLSGGETGASAASWASICHGSNPSGSPSFCQAGSVPGTTGVTFSACTPNTNDATCCVTLNTTGPPTCPP